MKYIKKIKIDIDKNNFEVIPSVQYDSNTRFLHINLLNGSVPFDITGCSVKISGSKPDGTAIFNNCTVVNAKEGFVEVELTEQMNAVPGTLKCELKIYDGNGVLTTKQFYIEVTASVTSKSITSSNEFKALTDALNEVQSFENKIDEIANKGTTTEVLKKTTEDYIQEKIEDGTIANLTLEDNSITNAKISDEAINTRTLAPKSVTLEKLGDDIELEPPVNSITTEKLNLMELGEARYDIYSMNASSAIGVYPTYQFENLNVADDESTSDITFSYVFYSEQDITFKLGAKMFSNNDSVITNITGGQTIAIVGDSTDITAKKGFNKCVFKLKGVLLKYKYHKLMPWIKFTLTDPNTPAIFAIGNVKYDNESLALHSKKGTSGLKELGMDNLLDKQLINTEMLPKAMEQNKSFILSFLENYNKGNFLEIHIPNIYKANGGIQYPVISMDKSVRQLLEPYEYRIPKGTKFKYTIDIDTQEGELNAVGLQIFMSSQYNDGSYETSVGYKSFTRKTINGEKSFLYEYELDSDTSFEILESKYLKFFFDTVFTTGTDFRGSLIYRDIEFILPDGNNLYKPLYVYCSMSSAETLPSIVTLPQKPILYEYYVEKNNVLKQEIDNELNIMMQEIKNAKRVPSRWTGKRYTSVGDSITWQHEKTNYLPDNEPLKGYQYYVIERLGIGTFINNGVSGMTMAKYDGWTNSFIDKYKSISWGNYDLITIALGTNDFGNGGGCEVGDVDSSDVSTFYGAYNTVINYILTVNPKIRIILMTPFQRKGQNTLNSKGYKLIDYVNAVINLGEKWSCPVYDCYRLSGWNESTFSIYTVDGLHGSADGFENSGIPLGEFLALQ